MTERTLSDAIAKQFFLTKVESKEIIQLLLSIFSESLAHGERVYLRGFGSFSKKKRAAKKVRHPKTGQMMTLPERVTVDFNPSNKLLKKLA